MGGTSGEHSASRREAYDRWYSFLADECRKDNGLLCFYDREKSPQVAYFCGLLGDCLTGTGESQEGEGQERFDGIRDLPKLGETSSAPEKISHKV
jgi:hypothetical protein